MSIAKLFSCSFHARETEGRELLMFPSRDGFGNARFPVIIFDAILLSKGRQVPPTDLPRCSSNAMQVGLVEKA